MNGRSFKKPVELIPFGYIVVGIHQGEEQGFAESPGTNKKQVFPGFFDFSEISGLIDIIIIFSTDNFKIRYPIRDFLYIYLFLKNCHKIVSIKPEVFWVPKLLIKLLPMHSFYWV